MKPQSLVQLVAQCVVVVGVVVVVVLAAVVVAIEPGLACECELGGEAEPWARARDEAAHVVRHLANIGLVFVHQRKQFNTHKHWDEDC